LSGQHGRRTRYVAGSASFQSKSSWVCVRCSCGIDGLFNIRTALNRPASMSSEYNECRIEDALVELGWITPDDDDDEDCDDAG
jgi:hypothetical protein